ncbi:hypothetical protein [Paenibacillus macerans]|uniref:hypothetical protein n=1 Tax=Paenibacillus macerans TaxID=44252 RepID=UPI003D315E5F
MAEGITLQEMDEETVAELATKDEVGPLPELLTTAKGNMVEAVNELFTNVSNGKTSVAAAITGKGVAASGSDTFAVLAEKIGQISSGGIKDPSVLPSIKGNIFDQAQGRLLARSKSLIVGSYGSTVNHSIYIYDRNMSLISTTPYSSPPYNGMVSSTVHYPSPGYEEFIVKNGTTMQIRFFDVDSNLLNSFTTTTVGIQSNMTSKNRMYRYSNTNVTVYDKQGNLLNEVPLASFTATPYFVPYPDGLLIIREASGSSSFDFSFIKEDGTLVSIPQSTLHPLQYLFI